MAAPGQGGLGSWWTPAGARARLARVDWLQIGAGALVTAALVAIASWQAASLRVGLIVCAGFAAVALVLSIAGVVIVYVVRPVSRVRYFPVRHAVLSFARPGNQTRVILLAVGLGSFFVIGVRTLEANLLQQFSLEMSAGGADMFLIEILPKQVDEVRTFLEQHKAAGAGPPRLIPVLRARVTGVRGRDVNLANVEDVRARGSLAREYTITYRDHLEPNEKIIDGKFWTGEPPMAEDARPAEVSVERSIHERFHIDVGDLVRFDVLGRVVEARVSSVRDVEWEDARNGGFMFVFRPGPFEHAPQTWIGILRAPEDPAARGRFQRDLVARFPNVSAIDVKEILTTIQQAVANVTLAITIVGAVALLSGVLISDRGRRDDQVSTGLRGGHPAYAGGQHAE